jgi:drug/metabolite transporter (DMT)-like permease
MTLAAPTLARTAALTALAMLAFAANSLLCRMALQPALIDPASFGSVRVASGAIALAAIVRLRTPAAASHGDWSAAAMLFAYVAFFSFAYLSLGAGTGALILFGAVQVTMLIAGLRAGEEFGTAARIGLALAVGGLVYLVLPGLSAPPLLGAALMAAAGVAWGLYSLHGRGVADPLAASAGNFLRAVPMALVLSALAVLVAGAAHAAAPGIVLAVLSGAITSGLGYVVWYAALRGLSASRAAVVQLSVPPIAAFGGALLLGESVSLRLALASAAILGGIAMVLTSRAKRMSTTSLPARPAREIRDTKLP